MSQLRDMTDRFYQKAFQDETLDKFLRSHEDPHGTRFAKWIHQKLSGSKKWDKDCQQRSQEPVRLAGSRRHVVHDRLSAHVAAWHSPKRNRKEVGRHFRLDECQVWMRLHFWALQESGIIEISPSFADYYIQFIAHFVRVYENAAPLFARDSFRWSSSNPKNIEHYIGNGRKMKDVLGLPFHKALAQIPESESEESGWPYDVTD
mmetsp:Transcript_14023/g.15414  ORF Transcript_14023/g.15414 Transcript_14023/m.15414 type:complete len:204 (-) Transcript_14023:153-764(-)